jgi:hypothetical protein
MRIRVGRRPTGDAAAGFGRDGCVRVFPALLGEHRILLLRRTCLGIDRGAAGWQRPRGRWRRAVGFPTS